MLGLYLDHKLGVLFISQSIFDFISAKADLEKILGNTIND